MADDNKETIAYNPNSQGFETLHEIAVISSEAKFEEGIPEDV